MTGQDVPLYMVSFSDCGRDLVLIHKGGRGGGGQAGRQHRKHTKETKTALAEGQGGEPAEGWWEGGFLLGLSQQSQVGSPAPAPSRG